MRACPPEVGLPKAGKYLKFLTYTINAVKKKGVDPCRNYPFSPGKLFSLLLRFYVALSATGRPRGLIGLLQIIMTSFAAFMVSFFRIDSLPFCLGLVTVFAKFACRLALFPIVMALQAIDLQCFRMFLMGEGYFPVRDIEGDRFFLDLGPCAAGHQDGEHKACKDDNT